MAVVPGRALAALLVLRALPAIAAQGTQAAAAGSLTFDLLDPSPVEVFQFGLAHARYRVSNHGTQPVRIRSITTRRGGGSGTAQPEVIAPGAQGEVDVQIRLDSLGVNNLVFIAATDEADSQTYRLPLATFVQSAYFPESPQVGVESMRQGETPVRELSIETREADHLSLKAVLSAPPWLSVEAVPADAADGAQRVRLKAQVKANAPLGFNQGMVHLLTDLAPQPDFVFPVYARVFRDVSVTPMPASVGALHPGDRKSLEFEYRALDGGELALDKLEQSAKDFSFDSKPCGKGCVAVTAKFVAGDPRNVGGAIRARFKGRADPVDVPYSGVIVPARTKIVELGDVDQDTTTEQKSTGEKP